MDAINTLKQGYRKFLKTYFEDDRSLFENLAKGQQPKILMITCADSRVDPAILTQSEPGDLFTIRNVANLVPTYTEDKTHHGTSTGIEFAVCYLNVEHIIVMGHAQCGGIQALVDKPEPNVQPSYIPGWMEIAEPVCQQVLAEGDEDKYRRCEQASVRASVANLKTYPWIEESLKNKKLKLHGWYFDISNGQILALDNTSNNFEPLV